MDDIFTRNDHDYFTEWIRLDFNAISWEGRHLDAFTEFWSQFLTVDLSLSEQFNRIEEAKRLVGSGPLHRWLEWVEEKLIVYTFVYKNESLSGIQKLSHRSLSETALILRSFFVDRFPHLEELLSERLHVGNILSENLRVSFADLKEEIEITDELDGTLQNEVLNSLEITLYSEWEKLYTSFTREEERGVVKSIQSKFVLKQQLRFIQELAVLFIIGGLLIFVVKIGNKWYEDYLEEKISLFEPDFFWLDKDLSFKGEKLLGPDDISVSLDQLEELEKIESKNVFQDDTSDSRFEVESDVVLTSVDALPKDFDSADLEQSNYEEVKKGGFRNNRYGRRKAYRVLLTSVDPRGTKQDLIKVLNYYQIEQVDNVKPGTEIPGGIYFNLNVPASILKEFLLKVSANEESMILESRTVSRGPAGTSRVFIWIKSI